MYIIWGEQEDSRPQTFETSVMKTNNSVTKGLNNIPSYSAFSRNWYQDDMELQQHYWAASFLLPLGSVLVLSVVILLMVLFKRCPHIIAGIVAGLLGTIIIFIILMSVTNAPIYT